MLLMDVHAQLLNSRAQEYVIYVVSMVKVVIPHLFVHAPQETPGQHQQHMQQLQPRTAVHAQRASSKLVVSAISVVSMD